MNARSVLLAMLLVAGAISPPSAAGQAPAERPRFETNRGFSFDRGLGGPVRPEMSIPFYLEDKLFENNGRVVVSLRIYNVLKQPIAIPVLRDEVTGRQAEVLNLAILQPGRKIAYWNGKDLTGATVATGVYYCELQVGDQTATLKLVVESPRRRSILPWR